MELVGDLLNSRRGVHGVSLRDFVPQNNDVLGSRFWHDLPVTRRSSGLDQLPVMGKENRGVGVSKVQRGQSGVFELAEMIRRRSCGGACSGAIGRSQQACSTLADAPSPRNRSTSYVSRITWPSSSKPIRPVNVPPNSGTVGDTFMLSSGEGFVRINCELLQQSRPAFPLSRCRFPHNFRMAGGHAQQHPRGPAGRARALLPMVKRADADSE